MIGGRRRVVTRRRFHTDDGEDRSFARQLGDQATPSDEGFFLICLFIKFYSF